MVFWRRLAYSASRGREVPWVTATARRKSRAEGRGNPQWFQTASVRGDWHGVLINTITDCEDARRLAVGSGQWAVGSEQELSRRSRRVTRSVGERAGHDVRSEFECGRDQAQRMGAAGASQFEVWVGCPMTSSSDSDFQNHCTQPCACVRAYAYAYYFFILSFGRESARLSSVDIYALQGSAMSLACPRTCHLSLHRAVAALPTQTACSSPIGYLCEPPVQQVKAVHYPSMHPTNLTGCCLP
jgi:hypothetical protein